jgi:hypothetical protein
MSDIVEDLRLLQSGAQWACGQTAATLEDAAAEIERMRAEMRSITKVPRSDAAYGIIQCIARAALKDAGHE